MMRNFLFGIYLVYVQMLVLMEAILCLLLIIVQLLIYIFWILPIRLLQVLYLPVLNIKDYFGKKGECTIYNSDGSSETTYKRIK